MTIAKCALSSEIDNSINIISSLADSCLDFEQKHLSELSLSKQRATKSVAEAKALKVKIEQQEKLFHEDRAALNGQILPVPLLPVVYPDFIFCSDDCGVTMF